MISSEFFQDQFRLWCPQLKRLLWNPPYSNELPAFPCPACREGHLISDKKDLLKSESGPSIRAHGHEAWDPEWIEERFVALLRCNSPSCGDVVGLVGKGSYLEGYVTHGDGSWEQVATPTYTPISFWEAPPIIRVCEECPDSVLDQLKRSFPQYWLDLSACANAIRSTVEILLTERGIPRETEGKHGRKVWINLHDRVVMFKTGNDAAAELLLAIKVLGNAGSHGDELRIDDLLDAYEVLEHVIDIVYSTKATRAAAVAAKLKARLE